MTSLGGRGRSRAWFAFGVMVAALSVLVCMVQVARAKDPLDPANFNAAAALPLAVLAFVADRWQPRATDLAGQARAAAATLANRVSESEGAQLELLLGGSTDRINLTYTLVADPYSARAPGTSGRLRAVGTSVSVPDVAAYYRATQPRRLVVTGDPGAGKTTLALELMMVLIDGRPEGDPVPVRLSLAEWDPEIPLDAHMTTYLVRSGWPRRMASELVRNRLVLPVLDGLDEMDPTLANGDPDPSAPRALAALRALSRYQSGGIPAPLILTCRSGHYQALDEGVRLAKAVRVAIEPVDTADALDYLTERAGGAASIAARWQPVLDTLRAYPGGTLARTLSTPWRIGLVATVYTQEGDPSEVLAHPTPAALDRHLLARYLPASTTLYSEGGYTPDQVHRWLHHLAAHLGAVAAETQTAGTDMVLHDLWPMAGRARVRLLESLLVAAAMLLPFLAAALLVDVHETGSEVRTLCLASVVIALNAGLSPDSVPIRFNLRQLRTPAIRHRFAFWLALGLAGGILIGAENVTGFDFVSGIAVSFSLALVVGLVSTLVDAPAAATTPRSMVRGGYLSGLITTFVFWSVFALVDAIGGDGVAGWLKLSLGLGIGLGLLRAGVTRRYLVFHLCLRFSRRRLPFHLARFLDWAVGAGILRLSGPAYQFRHRELQGWLARHATPPWP